MNTKILHAYVTSCSYYGWTPSFEGLRAYREQLKTGLRELWSGVTVTYYLGGLKNEME